MAVDMCLKMSDIKGKSRATRTVMKLMPLSGKFLSPSRQNDSWIFGETL
ncbi:hypothetical protein C4J90_3400 [Pseudomonas sp. R2-60-08W]|nr:hypothetical protein C4J90_3400 [Pseudomonas sp. R2-60-08W]